MPLIVGIDLGTTNSVVAVMKPGGPEVVHLKGGAAMTPSVVGVNKRGEMLVGDNALKNWQMAPRDTILSVKRLMGRPSDDPEVDRVRKDFLYHIGKPKDGTKAGLAILLGGKEVRPFEVSAIILRKLKDDVAAVLGESPTHAVITVPAYFNAAQRLDTQRAAESAGLVVLRLVDEPTAAAVALGIDDGTDNGGARTIVVYDLGGGTFDLSVLMMANSVFAPLCLEGDMWLGGDNFDTLIVNELHRRILSDHHIALPDKVKWALAQPRNDASANDFLRCHVMLRLACRAAKEALTHNRSADVIVPAVLKDADGDLIDIDYEITREWFIRAASALIQRSTDLMSKALKEAAVAPAEVDYVLLAGGSTHMCGVADAVRAHFAGSPAKIVIHHRPKELVALGAAILAARIGIPASAGVPSNAAQPVAGTVADDPVMTIAEKDYGLKLADGSMEVMVRKGDTIPSENQIFQKFTTTLPGQRVVMIEVFAGSNKKADKNEPQGKAVLALPPGLPPGTVYELRFSLTVDRTPLLAGRLGGRDLPVSLVRGEDGEVAATAIASAEIALAELAGGLTAVELQAARAAQDQAVRAFAQHEPGEAIDAAKRLRGSLQPGGGDAESPEAKADRLGSFARGLLDAYGWMFEEEEATALRARIDAVSLARSRGDRARLDAATVALDAATDRENLPGVGANAQMRRMLVAGVVRPADPKTAEDLMLEIDRIEAFGRQNLSAGRGPAAAIERIRRDFEAVEARLAAALEAIPDREPPASCPNRACGKPPGGRHCQHCGVDTLAPQKFQ